MASQLCRAPTPLKQAVQSVASRWKELKTALHAPDIPDAFDPRVRCGLFVYPSQCLPGYNCNSCTLTGCIYYTSIALLFSSTDITRNAVVTALKQLREEKTSTRNSTYDTATGTTDAALTADADNQARRFVFVLADFDELDEKQAEKWLQWTNEVTSNGLAHVVAPTRKAVTPERVQWLQARHHASHNDGDFVAILLRVAKDAVDRSNAEDKVHKVAVRLLFRS